MIRKVDGPPILICYDGSADAARGIEAAAALFGAGRAVVLNVAVPLTAAESVAVVSPVAPAAAFEQAPSSPGPPASRPRLGPSSRLRPGRQWSTWRTRWTRPRS
jgi:hypothetical protein